jgi:prophage tail gpP-like protein
MSNVISEITIEKRINNASATFNITFKTPTAPTDFVVGKEFEFILTDGTQSDEFIVFRGMIESVKRDDKNQNRIYSVTGRDAGRLLTRQPFKLDCETTNARDYTYNEILNMIIEDTDLNIGRGLVVIEGEV